MRASQVTGLIVGLLIAILFSGLLIRSANKRDILITKVVNRSGGSLESANGGLTLWGTKSDPFFEKKHFAFYSIERMPESTASLKQNLLGKFHFEKYSDGFSIGIPHWFLILTSSSLGFASLLHKKPESQNAK